MSQENSRINPAETVAAAVSDGKTHLLLACTGSVATIKIKQIILGLADFQNLSIRVVVTASAAKFLTGENDEQPSLAQVRSMPNVDALYLDEDEWGPQPWRRGANILHIELRRWASLLVIAPLSANSLAKLAGGFSDNLLTSTVRAWDTTTQPDGSRKRIVIAPGMNTQMYRHPVTARHLKVIEEDCGGPDGWIELLRPISKALACGDVGDGAMVEWGEIVGVIEKRLGLTRAEGGVPS
ncbi:phosphopantothenoylcysteine decarboxylase [Plectosphaerella plurivora]|uniref:Phosphopantothenoylcysteine decarboxylase n=1 Tax=Plectosphaerella plurivora TaxID=936078 RepID=A0A9P9AD88_9PEZI|nr:phosphopantothenoylcysteine decarboxylase [Plectosphaerella plurivora]